MSGCRSEAGRLLQILGLATEKLVASQVFVLGTVRLVCGLRGRFGMLGSIDANTGSPDLGWDTDQFPMDVKNSTLVMKVDVFIVVTLVELCIVFRKKNPELNSAYFLTTKFKLQENHLKHA